MTQKHFVELAIAAALLASSIAARTPDPQSKLPDWEDPVVFSRNAEPPHTTYTPYGSVEDAVRGEPARSPYDEYMLYPKEYSYSFRLRPFSGGDGTPEALSKTRLE